MKKRMLGTRSLLVGCALMMMMMTMIACGSSSQSACEEAGTKICQMACDCATDRCTVGTLNPAGVTTIATNTFKECTDLYVVLGCMEDNKDIDYARCGDDLDAAQCVEAGEGSALLLPESCKPPSE